jgi:uncharacterized membrane protein affecting hemolysin expression
MSLSKKQQQPKNTIASMLFALNPFKSNDNRPQNYLKQFLALAFSLTLIALAAVNYLHAHDKQHLMNLYGNSITQLIAQQLSLSLSSEDLISLRSSLDDIIEQENVINAIVYDIDNRALAQAGPVIDNDIKGIVRFSSALTLDKTLVGNLTVNLKNKDNHKSFFYLLLLYTGLLITLFLFYQKKILAAPKSYSTDDNNHNVEQKKEHETHKKATETLANQQTILILQFKNLNKIHQQLNASAKIHQFDRFQSILNKVLTLYSGKIIANSSDSIVIIFENTSDTQSTLNALCCAYLLNKNCDKNQLLLKFFAVIYSVKNNDKPLNIYQLIQENKYFYEKSQQSIFIASDNKDDNELYSKFTYKNSPTNDFYEFIEFVDNYKNLIEKQLEQLQNA